MKPPVRADGEDRSALAADASAGAPAAASAAGHGALTVFYDGACPLCRREIALYRGLPARCPVVWADAADAATPLPPDHPRETLLARFHVRDADGRWRSGADGFVALWSALPRWRVLAALARLPGVPAAMEAAYRGFLRGRPALQRLAAAFEPVPAGVPADLVPDLRSDHAGEAGAVWIYRGLLATARDAGVRAFARRHLATESRHLREVSAWLPWRHRSRLLPIWRVAGFLTGALPALAGPRAVYATIAAVETFVDHHYQAQIDRLAGHADGDALRTVLDACRRDELAHRDEAQAAARSAPGALLRAWCRLVDLGSRVAVAAARRL